MIRQGGGEMVERRAARREPINPPVRTAANPAWEAADYCALLRSVFPPATLWLCVQPESVCAMMSV
jgi:hypothetical protein